MELDHKFPDDVIRKLLKRHAGRHSLFQLFAEQEDEFDTKLLSRDFDGVAPWLDSVATITPSRISLSAAIMEREHGEIVDRYNRLSQRYGFTVADDENA
ncbi:MAG: hypothetical protein WCP68_20760 [Enhydrobacter sp.]